MELNTMNLNLSDKEKYDIEAEHLTKDDIIVLTNFMDFFEDAKDADKLEVIQDIIGVNIMIDSFASEEELILNELMMHFDTNKLSSMAAYRIIRKRLYDLYQLAIK